MSRIVLKDGRVLHLSTEQSERLGMVILLTTNLDKGVKVGDQKFKLSDIVTDPKEIASLTQQSLIALPPKKNGFSQ